MVDDPRNPGKFNPAQKIVDPNASDASRTSKGNQALANMPGHRAYDSIMGVGADRQALDGRKQQRDLSDRVANCQVLFQNGNCNSGEDFWFPPDGDWGNYPGIGGSASNRSGGSIMADGNPGNPSGYDFVGGQTTSTTNVTTALIEGSYSTVEDNDLIQTRHKSVNACNCGVGGVGTSNYNCYSNCNCACVCVCVCVCDCDCISCFPGWTTVVLADGTEKRMDRIVPGEVLKDIHGADMPIQGVEVVRLGSRSLYSIYGQQPGHGEVLIAQTTEEHSFLTADGFKSLNPQASADEKGVMAPVIVDADGTIEHWLLEGRGDGSWGQLAVGDRIVSGTAATDPAFTVTRIVENEATYPDNMKLYTLVCKNICQINHIAWVSAWSDQSIDWPAFEDSIRETFG